MGFDWDSLREKYLARIQWEIDQGLDPIEAFELDESLEKPPDRPAMDRTGIGGQPRKYDHEQVLKLYTENNLSGQEIAKLLGANPATIYLIIRKAGATKPHPGTNQHTRKEPA